MRGATSLALCQNILVMSSFLYSMIRTLTSVLFVYAKLRDQACTTAQAFPKEDYSYNEPFSLFNSDLLDLLRG